MARWAVVLALLALALLVAWVEAATPAGKNSSLGASAGKAPKVAFRKGKKTSQQQREIYTYGNNTNVTDLVAKENWRLLTIVPVFGGADVSMVLKRCPKIPNTVSAH